ncbi:MAG TPA: hypothetical protein VH684_17275 [Xanthobacteraceae bacterium]|jgi:hypothetical protein
MDRVSVLAGAALLCFASIGAAQADEALKFRGVMHAAFAEFQQLDDIDGHTFGMNRHSGIASLPDGTAGTCYLVANTDYVRGAGTFTSFNGLTLKDGSELWYRASGKTRVDGPSSQFEGTVTIVGGKGRFEGAKGDGTFTGTRLSPLAVGADLYIDWIINVKK